MGIGGLLYYSPVTAILSKGVYLLRSYQAVTEEPVRRQEKRETMQTTRTQKIQEDVKDLIENFDEYLRIFDNRPPFQKPGQLDFHRNTISFRRSEVSAINAISNDLFLRSLYQTIQAWGIGKRGSNLSPYSEFKKALQSKANQIAKLDGLRIDDPKLDLQGLSNDLWQLMDSLEIVQNLAKLVSSSKTLHHILPDLVVPIDRAYTRKFFGRHMPEFQNGQRKFLFLAIENFSIIARATNPEQFVGKKWNTCQTKVIDNAIVGYMMTHPRKDL
jgi:hypothetical protein